MAAAALLALPASAGAAHRAPSHLVLELPRVVGRRAGLGRSAWGTVAFCSALAFAFPALASGAPATRGTTSAPEMRTMKPPATSLKGAELRKALVGQVLYETGADGHPGSLAELFRSDGQWEMTGTRAPLYGRYRITNDQVCVDRQGALNCRRLYRDASGALFTVAVTAPGARQPAPVRVLLLPPAGRSPSQSEG